MVEKSQLEGRDADFLPAFTAGEKSFALAHVLQAAAFRGELDALVKPWRASLAQDDKASDSEDDTEAIGALLEEFRYARDLITAEEFEQWLESRGVTMDEVTEEFTRRWRAGQLDPGSTQDSQDKISQTVPSPPMADRAFRVSLLLSDAFNDMARALAWRVALQREAGNTASPAEPAPLRAEFQEAHHFTEEELAGWLEQWGGAPEWFDELLRLEAIFQVEWQKLVEPEKQQRALASQRLQLLRVELEILDLDSEAAAAEAFLCVKADGVPLAELARESGFVVRRESLFVDQLPADWQQACLSAAPGTVLTPFPGDQGFTLCVLLAKREASLDDPEVLKRVDETLRRTHFMELEHRHIEWRISIEVEEDEP